MYIFGHLSLFYNKPLSCLSLICFIKVLLFVQDQQEGYDKSNKEATAVPTRQEIVTLQVGVFEN
jgi:hypothetical protein